MKFVLKSFGCQMNKLDSALVTSAMKQAGFEVSDSPVESDVVIINTCSVRQHAEERVLSHLGHLKHIRKSRPGLVVAVMGCMAQRMGEELLANEAVDIVCGPGQIDKLPELIQQRLEKKAKHLAVAEKIRAKVEESEAQGLEEFEVANDLTEDQLPGQAYVRAMRGCNKFCTYCVVPYVRGPEASRPPESIISQIKHLRDQGIKLVTLLGQTIDSYSYTENGKKWGLAELLEGASAVEGIEWVRFITSYPTDLDDSILAAMAGNPKVCKYLHLPAQSGSDKILKAMNRTYTSGQYLELLTKAREMVPGIAIAGDFIVGFCGESDEDFEATVSLVQKARYKSCYIFKYSPRPGTTAEKRLEDDVPEDVKKARNTRLLEVQSLISEEDNGKLVGRQMRGLVEGPSKKAHLDKSSQDVDHKQLISRTGEDYIVVFNGPAQLAGQFAQVKITKASALTLFGEL